MPTAHWRQHNITFPDRDTAEQVITNVIGPALAAAEADGHLSGWWYMNKQPWPLRYQWTERAPTLVDELLDRLVADGRATAWAAGIYEPETQAFGGEAAMDVAHQLFHQDARHLLTYGTSQTGRTLGRRETSILLCSAMMRAAGLDWYEQGDVWGKVADLRPPGPGALSPDRATALVPAMVCLLTVNARTLSDPTKKGPLTGYDEWVTAFEHAGHTLAHLSRHGRLTRGLRAVLAHHVIFHTNRARLPLADQSTMSALAKEAIMGPSDNAASTPGASPESTTVGRVNSDTVKENNTTAERLRNALINQVVTEGRVRTPRIEKAMRSVPRHLFVPKAPLEEAYANATVSIKDDAEGASISCASQPSIIGMMLEQLHVQPGDSVLELGTGTGYNAALLAHLAGPTGHVVTLDVDDDIVDGARTNLAAAGFNNVDVILRDGALGHPDGAPYLKIVATVGAHGIPHAWLDQLAPGGRLLVPMRLRGSVSRSIAFEHNEGRWLSVGSEMNTFMPLRRGIADDERRLIPVTSTGVVRLQTNQAQDLDEGALAGVLDQPRTVLWSEVLYRAMESPEWMELWLTCTMPNGLNYMPAQAEATSSGLLTDPYPSSTAVFDKGALTYLTRRLSTERTSDGGKLWEFGVVGHGPGGDALAEQVAESMRTWDREYRSREATFELRPLHSEPIKVSPGRFAFDTPLNQIVVQW